MNEFPQRSTRSIRCTWALGAAGIALAFCACTRDNREDVKPTATTAYRSAQPGAQQPGTAPAQPRQ
jgi:hypothetical protein